MSLNDYMDDPPEFESSDIDDTLRGTLIIYDSLAWKIMQVVDGHKQTFKYCKIVMKWQFNNTVKQRTRAILYSKAWNKRDS